MSSCSIASRSPTAGSLRPSVVAVKVGFGVESSGSAGVGSCDAGVCPELLLLILLLLRRVWRSLLNLEAPASFSSLLKFEL